MTHVISGDWAFPPCWHCHAICGSLELKRMPAQAAVKAAMALVQAAKNASSPGPPRPRPPGLTRSEEFGDVASYARTNRAVASAGRNNGQNSRRSERADRSPGRGHSPPRRCSAFGSWDGEQRSRIKPICRNRRRQQGLRQPAAKAPGAKRFQVLQLAVFEGEQMAGHGREDPMLFLR